MKRLLIIGALAAASAFTFAISANAAPGPNGGSCTLKTSGASYLAGGTPAAGQPVVGDVYGSQTGTTAGNVGIGTPTSNYIEAGGSQSGGYVSGNNGADIQEDGQPAPIPHSGVNGTTNIGTSPSACVGVAGKGGVNT